MIAVVGTVLVVLVIAAVVVNLETERRFWSARKQAPALRSVSPRVVSNQTSTPLALVGERFVPGMTLKYGFAARDTLPVTVIDSGHAFARLPAGLGAHGSEPQVELELAVGDDWQSPVKLTVVDDVRFPELRALAASPDGHWAFAASTTEDRVYVIDTAAPGSAPPRAFPTRDGPIALAVVKAPDGPQLWVGHQFDAKLSIFRIRPDTGLEPLRDLPAPSHVGALAVDDARQLVFVADHLHDAVVALEVASGRPRWTTPVDPNPGALASDADRLWVGSLQTGVVQLLDPSTGKLQARLAPRPGTPIVGGHTEPYSGQIMGGSPVRSLAAVPGLGVLAATLGPNIGPNADRMEVSMNGGLTALTDPQEKSNGRSNAGATVLRHLGFGAGVPNAVVYDPKSGRAFVADPALGVVRVVEPQRLFGSEAGARGALVQTVAIPPPAGFPLFRKATDFGVEHRAGVEVHSGPVALALAGDTLFVLDRFTGTLAVLSTGAGAVAFERQLPVCDTLGQKKRRLGEVLFFADLGQTAMSCDACHIEGHTGGVLFAKTHPMRIYRSPTIRGARETAPYFIPASTFSLAQTAHEVGNRNRYQNPQLTDEEIEDLALFVAALPAPPNPYRDETGSLLPSLALPDGPTGNPRAGLALFEGKAGCQPCHPAPHFTTDQDPATRGRSYDVGTEHLLPLRPALQEAVFKGFPAPSLLGAWDLFPLQTTGMSGLGPGPDGALEVKSRFPLRVLLDERAGALPDHGKAAALAPQERDDLIAYVLSL